MGFNDGKFRSSGPVGSKAVQASKHGCNEFEVRLSIREGQISIANITPNAKKVPMDESGKLTSFIRQG